MRYDFSWHFVTRFGLNPAYCDFLFDLCMVVSCHTFGLNPGEASALDVYTLIEKGAMVQAGQAH